MAILAPVQTRAGAAASDEMPRDEKRRRETFASSPRREVDFDRLHYNNQTTRQPRPSTDNSLSHSSLEWNSSIFLRLQMMEVSAELSKATLKRAARRLTQYRWPIEEFDGRYSHPRCSRCTGLDTRGSSQHRRRAQRRRPGRWTLNAPVILLLGSISISIALVSVLMDVMRPSLSSRSLNPGGASAEAARESEVSL